ncbi:MAG: hypothetical protein AB1798_07540 [Spirochaetota bacterium]
MTIYSKRIIYPEGDYQEIPHALFINQMVDLNGYPIQLPLRTSKMIVYRVFKITTKLLPGEELRQYHLELVTRDELKAYTKESAL